MHQHRELGRSFDQRADRGALQPDDQIAFPMPGHCPVVGLGGALADHHLGRDMRPCLSLCPCAGNAQGATRPQAGDQLDFVNAPPVSSWMNHDLTGQLRRCVGHRPGDPVSADQELPCPAAGTHLSAHREDAVSAVSGQRASRIARGPPTLLVGGPDLQLGVRPPRVLSVAACARCEVPRVPRTKPWSSPLRWCTGSDPSTLSFRP